MSAYGRRADVHPIGFKLRCLYHLDAQHFSISTIVFETFFAVMAKLIVVADNQLGHVEPFFQHPLHKLARRKCGHILVEIQHHYMVDACFAQQFLFLFGR